MADLITIMWRDIPAQVTRRSGRNKVGVQLDNRFQMAIDRAAANAGKETTDEYLAEWRRDVCECGSDLTNEANRAATRLEERFTRSVLASYVSNGGFEPTERDDDA